MSSSEQSDDSSETSLDESTNNETTTIQLSNGEHLIIEEEDDGTLYKINEMTNKFHVNIHDMRNQHMLCDVTLVADHTEIRAHKLILAATSLVFYTMFSGLLGKFKNRIVLEGVHRLALPPIISYIYTGEILINEDNVEILLKAANKLGVMGVFNACCHFLQENLNRDNCFHIASLARKNNCLELIHITDTFMREHFRQISKTKAYLKLPPEKLTEIIQSDELKVSSEIKVFEAVMEWIKHKLDRRRQYLASLMKHVRFPLMSLEDLIDNVEQEPLFEANSKCVDYVREAMRYQLMKSERKAEFSSPRIKPRVLFGSVQTRRVLVVAGSDENDSLTLETYDFDERRWQPGPESFTRKRKGSAWFNTGDKIYMFGNSGCNMSNNVDVFDMRLQMWLDCRDLLEERIATGAAILDGVIYVSGGWKYEILHRFSSIKSLKSCEKLDQQTRRWEKIADMNEERRGHCMCAMDGKIYALGGYSSSSVEYYCPKTNAWTLLPSMIYQQTTMHGKTAVELNGKLYVMGGGNGYGLEVFDPVEEKWTILASMNYARTWGAGAVAENGLIYIAGGINARRPYVEVYDPRIDSWKTLPNHLIKGKDKLSAAVTDWPS